MTTHKLQRRLFGLLICVIISTVVFWIVPLAASSINRNTYTTFTVDLRRQTVYRTLKTGDLNSDGLDDIVVNGFESLEIILQNTNGSFRQAEIVAKGDTSGKLILADLNGDQSLDICFRNGSRSFVIAFNDGNGNFTSQITYDQGDVYQVRSLFTLERGNSHVPHIGVITVENKTRLSLYLNNGQGSFTLNMSISLHGFLKDIASCDYNGDGDEDIVLLQTDGNLSLLTFNFPDISLQHMNILQWTGINEGAWLIPTDLNGDLNDDLIIVANEELHQGRVAFLLSNGLNLSDEPSIWSFGSSFLGANAADLDYDFDEDIIITLLDGHILAIENDLSGTPMRYMVLPTLILPHSPTAIHMVNATFPSIVVINQRRVFYDTNEMQVTLISKSSGVLSESVWFASQYPNNLFFPIGQVTSVILVGLTIVSIIYTKNTRLYHNHDESS
jgi:hypothetical protein